MKTAIFQIIFLMTKLMAILNVTPNSFYTGVPGVEQAIVKGLELVRESANLKEFQDPSVMPSIALYCCW